MLSFFAFILNVGINIPELLWLTGTSPHSVFRLHTFVLLQQPWHVK